jgi:hypothetical protein
MLRLTDAFVWEDMPTREPDTGSLSMVAWIPRIQKVLTYIMYSAITTHLAQSTLRIILGGDRSLLYSGWYPFDTTKTPAYELINIVQVKLHITKQYSFSLLFTSCYVKYDIFTIFTEKFKNLVLIYWAVFCVQVYY